MDFFVRIKLLLKLMPAIFLGLGLILLSGCETTAKFDEVASGTALGGSGGASSPAADFSFDGISSIDQRTDSTLRINWTAHADAVEYTLFNVTSSTPALVQTISGQASNNVILTGLTPNQLYRFRVRARDTQGRTDLNTHDVSVTTNLAPNLPSAIALSGVSSSSHQSRPSVLVSGIKANDTIEIFSDSTCLTSVSNSSVASSSTITIQTNVLPSVGSYNFYARATNSIGEHACSSVSVAYTYNLCPDNYIPVPGDSDLGTSDFCVMKWEAKAYKNAGADQGFNADALEGCTAGCAAANWAPLYHPDTNTTGYRPVSSATAKPWRRIDQDQARIACSNLGTGYALISNPEWMTIAHNIYERDSNWSNGNVGDGFLNRGHSDNNPAGTPCDGQIENVQTNCTTLDPNAATTSWNQKRTHTLSNGEVIWDIAGNVYNWVDWNVTPSEKAYRAADGSPQNAWREWNTIDTNINNGDEMETSTWQSTNVGANSTMGIGQYYAGSNASGGAALRGGLWNFGAAAGAFALNLSDASAVTSTGVGFRCVFRP